MKRLILSLIMTLAILPAFCGIFFVDATNGNDGNNGTATATPWKTINKINTSTFNPGDVICFKNGERWREQLTYPSSGSAGNPIIITTYGYGAAPIFSGFDTKNTGWTSNGTRFQFQSTVASTPNIVYINGVRGRKQTSVGNIDSAFEWFYTGTTLTIYAPTNSDPGAYYSARGVGIEIGQRGRVIVCNNKTDWTVNGIQVEGANTGSLEGAIRTGPTTATNLTFQNMLIWHNRGEGIDVEGSSTCSGIVIQYCKLIYNEQFGILIQPASTGTNELKYSNISYNGWSSAADNQQISNVQGNLGNWYIHHNEISYCTPNGGLSGGTDHNIYYSSANTAYCWIYNNSIHHAISGAGIKNRNTAWIAYNSIFSNQLESLELGGNGSTASVTYLIGNYMWNSLTGFSAVFEDVKGTGLVSANIYNNTIYKHGQLGACIHINENIDTLRIKNNILYKANGRPSLQIPATMTHTTAIDYNCFYGDDGVSFQSQYVSTIYTSLASWTAASPSAAWDVHSINSNPSLLNPLNNNFYINTSSPCYNVGTSVPYVAAYTANLSIGAWQPFH